MLAKRRLYNLCGRVHLGPVCVNGGDKGQAICIACGEDVTQADRALIGHMWTQVREILRPFKVKS